MVKFADREIAFVFTVVQLTIRLLATAPDAIVIVPSPELVVTFAVSDEDGAVATAEPPSESDQLVVAEAFHVPVPPTQYLLAPHAGAVSRQKMRVRIILCLYISSQCPLHRSCFGS